MARRPARRHHVVSKFYLRGFADDRERIMRHPLKDRVTLAVCHIRRS